MFSESLKRGGEEVAGNFVRESRKVKLFAGRPSRSIKEIIKNMREDYSVDVFRTNSKFPRQQLDYRAFTRARSCHLGERFRKYNFINSIGNQERHSAISCIQVLKLGHQNIKMTHDIQKFFDSLIQLKESYRRGESSVGLSLSAMRDELKRRSGAIEEYKREIAHCRMTSQILKESLEHSTGVFIDMEKQIKFCKAEVKVEEEKIAKVSNDLNRISSEISEVMKEGEVLNDQLQRLKIRNQETLTRPFASHYQNKEAEYVSEAEMKSDKDIVTTAAQAKDAGCQDIDCEKSSKYTFSFKASKPICQTCISKSIRSSAGFSTFNLSDVDSKNIFSSKTFKYR